VGNARRRVAAGKIDREHQWPFAVSRGDLVGKGVEFRLAARHQRQLVTVLGKYLRERSSDARGGAGEHGDGSIKRHDDGLFFPGFFSFIARRENRAARGQCIASPSSRSSCASRW